MTDETIKFVQLIENYQCLYNNTLQEYSRKDVTEKAWSTIAKQMQWSSKLIKLIFCFLYCLYIFLYIL